MPASQIQFGRRPMNGTGMFLLIRAMFSQCHIDTHDIMLSSAKRWPDEPN